MENSPTEQVVAPAASQEPTAQEQQPAVSAEQVNQETNSGANTQGSVSDGTAIQQTQTQEQGGETNTDDGLAKFAKSQGFDLENAADDVKRALKIAHDNQKAFRERGASSKIVEATKAIAGDATEARIAALEAQHATETFFSQEGRDRSLEAKMAEVLNERKEQYGAEYARVLSQDLPLLYQLASNANGSQAQASQVDIEAIRREERESINKAMSASNATPHATQGMSAQTPKVTQEWIDKEYDPRNPEHLKIVDEFYSQK